MIGKVINSECGRKMSLSLDRWLKGNQAVVFLCSFAFCAALFVYGLLAAVDLYSQYVIQSRADIEMRNQQAEVLLYQVDQLQQAVNDRQMVLSQFYQRILPREGRLKKEHIVNGNVTRLVAHAALTREPAITNRSFSRYSPFQFDVTMPSAVTVYELEQVLDGSQLGGLGQTFVTAEMTYGINAMFLAALAAHESNWGKSALAREKNNLFGFGAYDTNPFSAAAIFDSKQDCILYVAQFIREQYIDGQNDSGRNIMDINRKYASDEQWGQKVFMLMLQLDRFIQDNDQSR